MIAVYVSAWLAMLGWFAGSFGLFRERHWARWAWPIGAALQLVHVLIAFHFAHGWSHITAYMHTRRVGGVGEGLYVNYAFTALWLADAGWLLASPRTYHRRARWLNRAVHIFLLFIIFNAMVLFGSWVAQWLFAGFVCVFLFAADRH